MRFSTLLTLLTVLLIVAAGVASFGPWHPALASTVLLAFIKVAALAAVFFVAFLVTRRSAVGSPERKPWLLLTIGFVPFTVAQVILAFHQIARDEAIPFPSLADPFFVIACACYVWALFGFCANAARSGLPLGPRLALWSPALVVGVLLLAGAYPLVSVAIAASGSFLESFLHIYYLMASAIALAPCLVMLRVGLKFRGGRLIGVWLTMTIGFTVVLVSDVLFAIMTSSPAPWVYSLMSFTYPTGYVLIARGVVAQLELMHS